MTPATPSPTPAPLPGSWDVGLALHSAWHQVLVLVLVLLVVAVGGLVVLACRKDPSEQSEWQGWLDARSPGRRGD